MGTWFSCKTRNEKAYQILIQIYEETEKNAICWLRQT